MNHPSFCLSLLLLALAPVSVAEEPSTVVVRADRLLDVTTGELLADAAVVVVGDRIESVGPAADAPAEAEHVDLGDVTLLPGLVDAHTHLVYDPDWLQQRP